MNENYLARNLSGALALGLFLFAIVAFYAAYSGGGWAPACAGIVSSFGAYIWMRVAYMAHQDQL